MRLRSLLLMIPVMLLLPACVSPKQVPLAVQCPLIPPPPQEATKSVLARQAITPRLNSSVMDLTNSYNQLRDSLSKAMLPK